MGSGSLSKVPLALVPTGGDVWMFLRLLPLHWDHLPCRPLPCLSRDSAPGPVWPP